MNFLSQKVDITTGELIDETPLTDIWSKYYMDMPVDKYPGYSIEFFEEIG